MKKLFASILCFAMICGITGCSSSSDEYEIAMITDSGSVTDKSFNQSAYEGVKEFGEKNDMTYKYFDIPQTRAELNTHLVNHPITEVAREQVLKNIRELRSKKDYPDE